MKANKILIVAIVVLLVVAVFIYIQKKKKTPDKNVLDKILSNIFKVKSPGVTQTQPGYKITESPDYKFFSEQHYGDDYLSMFSQADLATMRHYIEDYTRKGIKIQPSDPIYKDVVRINSYAKMFNDLPTTI